MKTPVVDGLIILFARRAQSECSHAGLRTVIRLSGHDAVTRAAMATTGECIAIIAAGRIKNVADTRCADSYIGQYKSRLFAVSNAGFNLKIAKIGQSLSSNRQRFDICKRRRVIIQAVEKFLLLCAIAFNSNGYAVSRVCNPACLLVLPGKPGDKGTKSDALNETVNSNCYMVFVYVETYLSQRF